MDWKLWGKGLANAAINAAIGAVVPVGAQWAQQAATGVVPDSISGTSIGMISAGAAVLGAINFLLKSPRQNDGETKE